MQGLRRGRVLHVVEHEPTGRSSSSTAAMISSTRSPRVTSQLHAVKCAGRGHGGARPESGAHGTPQAGRIIVGGVEGDPGDLRRVVPRPVREHDRFTVSRRCAHDDEIRGSSALESFAYARAGHVLRRRPGRRDLAGRDRHLSRCGSSEQSLLVRRQYCRTAAVDTQLDVDGTQMRLDRVHRHPHLHGDLVEAVQ